MILFLVRYFCSFRNPCVCQSTQMQVSLPADKLLPYPPPSWARRLGPGIATSHELRFEKGIHQLFQGNLGLMLGWFSSEMDGIGVFFKLQYVNSKKQSDTYSHGRGTFKNRMAKHQDDLLMTVKPYVDDIARNPIFWHFLMLFSYAGWQVDR